ncbi:MAG: thiamine-phosphate kinase [Myxococcota bacterium]
MAPCLEYPAEVAGLDLRELGEFGLIGALRRRAGRPGHPWRVAIGDDAAILGLRSRADLSLTTDALIEGVHFRFETTSARALGAKALRVNLSDLGAMGARPLGFLLSLGLPADAAPETLLDFVSGLLRCARQTGCPLVGGDTVAAPVWTLGITAVGALPPGRALRRDAARPGQRVWVTGSLGGAALGLRLLESGAVGPGDAGFVRRQCSPDPPLQAGPKLLRGGLATAAIDVSDGLLQDLGHLARESGVAVELDLGRLPLARGLRRRAGELGLDPIELALSGGEDYELAFTAPARGPGAAALARRLACPVREIGRIHAGRGVRLVEAGRGGGREPGASDRSDRARAAIPGWNHFKTSGGRSEA